MRNVAGLLSLILFTATGVRGEVRVESKAIETLADTPTLVNLSFDEVPLKEAFTQLFAQARVPADIMLGDESTRSRKISLQLDGVPWAEALVRIAQAGEVRISRWNGHSVYQADDLRQTRYHAAETNPWIAGPADCDGPFCGVLGRVMVSRGLDYGSAPRARRVDVSFYTVPEPQIHAMAIGPFSLISNITDKAGTKKAGDLDEQWVEHASENIREANASVYLPKEFGDEIASLAVQDRMRIVSRFRRIDVDANDLVAGTELDCDGVHIKTLPPVDRREYGLAYSVRFTPGKGGASTKLLSDGAELTMIDRVGRVMRTLGVDRTPDGDTAVVRGSFSEMWDADDANAKPARLVILMPLAETVVTPTYHFSNIPLRPPVK